LKSFIKENNMDNLSDDDGLACEISTCDICGEPVDECECGEGCFD
jgi:hypothetical protein